MRIKYRFNFVVKPIGNKCLLGCILLFIFPTHNARVPSLASITYSILLYHDHTLKIPNSSIRLKAI